jgi:hypothetical protein
MKKLIVMLLAAAGIIFLQGCDNLPGNNEENNSSTGRLVIKVTDDPFNINLVESATVTISKIEIRESGEGEDSTFILVNNNPVTMNLLDLRNGVMEELADLELPRGKYDLICLYVTKAELTITGQPEPFKVKVPGGSQTGIKIFIRPLLEVEGGLTSELLLDFDLSSSFVMLGNAENKHGITGFNFKPTIRAVNLSSAGRVEGTVTDTASMGLNNVKVWLTKDSLVATTYTDSTGAYSLVGILAGTYSIHAYKDNYGSADISELKVVSNNKTIQNFVLVPE